MDCHCGSVTVLVAIVVRGAGAANMETRKKRWGRRKKEGKEGEAMLNDFRGTLGVVGEGSVGTSSVWTNLAPDKPCSIGPARDAYAPFVCLHYL